MNQDDVDRRRGRRASVEAPLLIRRLNSRDAEPFREHVGKNISMAGVYFETEGQCPFEVGEPVIASVSIPEPQRRSFPFTRLAGRSRVVRVKELHDGSGDGKKRFGIAIEFGIDMTALTTIPPRG